MKVIANKVGALAVDPRTVVHFTTNEKLEPGVKGLSEENIKRLIELKFVDILVEVAETESEVELVADIPEAYDFESINDKDELETYAKELYGVDLDRRQSLSKMKKELKKSIEGDK